MDEPQSARILVHCDLDAFFASVEILHHDLDPKRPLIIGSDPLQGLGRGIVSTCNYAARKYGIRSAMPISEAWRRCPAAPFGPGTYIQGTRGLYSRASRKVMNILKSNCDVFEQASIDEAYLDVTTTCHNDWDEAIALVRQMQHDIFRELGLTASFGIAPTKILAKMASEEQKPNGIFRILPNEIPTFFESRPLRDIPGIGPKSATRLSEWGLESMDEAYDLGLIPLQKFAGLRFASWLIRVYEGTTSNRLEPLSNRKSISKEHTFSKDSIDYEYIVQVMKDLLKSTIKQLVEAGAGARVLEVKLRYQGFETTTNQKSLIVSMDEYDVFWRIAETLFASNVELMRPVRLIGVRLGGLEYLQSRQETLL